MWNAGRVFALAQQGRLLRSLAAEPDPYVQLTINAVWALLLWGTAVALWQKRPLTRQVIPILLTIYAIYQLSLLRFFTPTPPATPRWLLTGLLYLGLILLTRWLLHRPAIGTYFDQKEVRE